MKFKVPVSVYILMATVLVILAFVNWDIYQKEQQLAQGKVVRLTLAPVDPRSLMQGDYMTLNYAIAAQLRALITMDTGDGLLQVKLDSNQVAHLVSVDNGVGTMEGSDIIDIQYRVRHNQIKFASNAYFFEEGQAADMKRRNTASSESINRGVYY
ncbi:MULTISPECIES: GDYXXLXY domain-containing protein [unclassified Shewanella]|uniref:GDYXXLXY domain-containing protein n=1 Tax=unclassified Shewanella TaxID=196818 RepID=UPI001BC6EDB4|nr:MULTISPECIES: GDYXXLXY domain-containing protein [unclassified Shewanella]GIU07745.1 hypothetical protein TUM4444_07660 [Shewanella sp. MBTL60-112-B1]GIU30376.1 hypothetical protein TUM4445_13650 [Shewanella sp. MBTL60-112-B2]